MDGVLIDTEKHYNAAWCQAATEAGFPFTREHALLLRSCEAKEGEKLMQGIFGPSFDYYAIRERRRELVRERLAQYGLEKKPGVEETLRFLRAKGIKTAVATATALDITKSHLTTIGVCDLFDSIVSAKNVAHGKPEPDVYLYACEQIGERPQDCMAVEDSPNGIMAAYRAGLRTVMVPDLTQPDEELTKYLYACVNSLSDLCELVDKED
ncbi:MAG: HAD family phosphatase [Lachnospiraceae bacterium]|jgi:HAD hydrolase, family IA, variant 3|nr:HAD family phosphatase [Lachnospiraceae bacterium]MBS4995027.1 HAD family phosphatase [Roseburia sp.]PWL90689.1 MAG: HAD family hydrolase [Lachnospiraceae bacterium]HCI25781.1 HAD family hydrolase [Lachnospiraceae bacterium]